MGPLEEWAVLRMVKTLAEGRDGAIGKVMMIAPTRGEAELFALKKSYAAVYTKPFKPGQLKPGQTLLVEVQNPVDFNSRKINVLIEETATREKHEALYTKEERQALRVPEVDPKSTRPEPLDRDSFKPEARSESIGVWKKTLTRGKARADIFVRTDGHGGRHETVLLTRPIRQADGTVKQVTTEHKPEDLRARYHHHLALAKDHPNAGPLYHLGVWHGPGRPTKGEKVVWSPGDEKQGRVIPLDGPTRDQVVLPEYVVCERTIKPGIWKVSGFTRNLASAESRMVAMEALYRREQRIDRRELFAQITSLVAKHDPNNERLKEGIRKLSESLGTGDRNRQASPQPPEQQRPQGQRHGGIRP